MQENIDAREIWLTYFNNTLFEMGVINQKERDKMWQLIRKKCHTPNRNENKSKALSYDR